MPRIAVVLSTGAVVSLLAACGVKPEAYYQTMRPNLLKSNYQTASDYLEKNRTKIFSEKDRLLYFMDQGMLLHLAKKYKESNGLMESAKKTAEDLWTESIGANAAAWVTTDNSLPYQGEDFEKVLLHFVGALNYIGLADYSAARVEARQVTAKLELYNSKYVEAKNAYRDDAFTRWLSGRLSETEGGQTALNDAWIDYKKALDVYQTDYMTRYRTAVPRFLVADALRVLQALGPEFQTELQQVQSRFPAVPFKPQAEIQGMGQVVVIHASGEAPYKVDKFWEAKAGPDVLRIAFPEFVAKPSNIVGARVSLGGVTADTELGENITAIAFQNLADHMGRIKAKAITRAVTKFIAAKAAQGAGAKMTQSGNQKTQAAGAVLGIAGAAFEVANAVAEEADKRSWITLPAAVNVAELFVPAGRADLQVAFVGPGGRPMGSTSIPVEVKAGEIIFVSLRTFD
ncbi:MAG: hypothetical protein HY903_14805 [Deltaproteobacteria bacterium]|nr:hypothetical protein [Deltaproteobacteria bacterium]